MTRFSKWQIAAMIALPLAITTNPLTVEIFLEWYKWLFTSISIITTAYLFGFLLYKVLKPEKINIPKKGKNKPQKYIDYDPKTK